MVMGGNQHNNISRVENSNHAQQVAAQINFQSKTILFFIRLKTLTTVLIL